MEFAYNSQMRSRQQGQERLRRAIERNRAKQAKRNNSSLRKTVVSNIEDTEFTSALRAPAKSRLPATIDYIAPVTPKKRAPRITKSPIVGQKKRKLLDYFVLAFWGFCFFLMIRLVVAERGIGEYYSLKRIFNEKLRHIERIKTDNSKLVNEIERIKSDSFYQKKLVRDNLGFISKDEYLILFAQK